MADDIDDLLDEVESKFIASSTRKEEKKMTKQKPKSKSRQDEELDDMISDICDAPEPLEKLDVNQSQHQRIVTSAQKKCFPVYLGGSMCATGLGNTMNQRTCDKLRCTDCDFRVVVFNDFSWHPSTDYLFLRNNVPDFKKLSAKLVNKKGSRAYACQCKFRTIKELTDLKTDLDLKWVCGKH